MPSIPILNNRFKSLHSSVVGFENKMAVKPINDGEPKKAIAVKCKSRFPKLLALNGVAKNSRKIVLRVGSVVEMEPGFGVQREGRMTLKSKDRKFINKLQKLKKVSTDHASLENEKKKGNSTSLMSECHLPIVEDLTPQPITIDMLRNPEEDEQRRFNCDEYSKDIVKYWMSLEAKWQLTEDYLDCSPDVTPKTRGILINWIVEVAEHLAIQQETLELCVNLIDRYVSIHRVKINNYQLLGVTCLFVACKYEERFVPEVKELLYLTENIYSFDHVMKQEVAILHRLAFQVFTPIPSIYVSTALRLVKDDVQSMEKVEHLTKYILTLSLLESHFSIIPASIRASSATSLAVELIGRSEGRKNEFESIRIIVLEETAAILVEKCFSSMASMVFRCHHDPAFHATRSLFSSKDHNFVSDLTVLSDSNLFKQLSIANNFTSF